ncbi:MAG TPA: zinc-binding dehydrogenase [Phycisphaerae bacterium]|nr:zinc-binding dehydrogenase [Phycisphaerae bacterium]
MKTARYHQTGQPDVIKLEEVPDPKPASGEVVIRVKAAALNRLDIFIRSGASTMPGFKMPHTGGFDVAGEVAEIGPDVANVKVGDPVVVDARVTGERAKGKLDIIGITRPGGFAEKVVVPAHCLRTKPTGYSFEEAAAFGCVYLTAYRGFAMYAAVKPGEVVLVHAGGSGAGTAAIQVAKAMGATVITTVGSDDKAAKAKELAGADYAVNYRTQDYAKTVHDVTCGRGVDVAFDPVWGPTTKKTLEALALGGRWIVIGMVGGFDATLPVGLLLFREVRIQGVVEFYTDKDRIDAAWAMAHRGLVRPIIAKTWPLAQLAEAHRQMEQGDVFGKIVVTP